MTGFDTSRQLLAEAAQHLPGGVNSNFRLGISPTPLVFERAEGHFCSMSTATGSSTTTWAWAR